MLKGPANNSDRSRIARYGLVGIAGFVIDAAILTLLVSGLAFGHYRSRAISFAVAVTATWLINRRWVFNPTDRAVKEYYGYFFVQVLGAIINLGVYVVMIETFPVLAKVPVVPLACGALIAMALNYSLLRLFVYSPLTSSQTH